MYPNTITTNAKSTDDYEEALREFFEEEFKK